jgi:hypothetical protein
MFNSFWADDAAFQAEKAEKLRQEQAGGQEEPFLQAEGQPPQARAEQASVASDGSKYSTKMAREEADEVMAEKGVTLHVIGTGQQWRRSISARTKQLLVARLIWLAWALLEYPSYMVKGAAVIFCLLRDSDDAPARAQCDGEDLAGRQPWLHILEKLVLAFSAEYLGQDKSWMGDLAWQAMVGHALARALNLEADVFEATVEDMSQLQCLAHLRNLAGCLSQMKVMGTWLDHLEPTHWLSRSFLARYAQSRKGQDITWFAVDREDMDAGQAAPVWVWRGN